MEVLIAAEVTVPDQHVGQMMFMMVMFFIQIIILEKL